MIGFYRKRKCQNTEFTAITQVEEYWHSLKTPDAIPTRHAINPSKITKALPHTFIMEQVAQQPPRFRIAGSKVSDILGLDLRGMPITSLIAPDDRRLFAEILADMFRMPATARIQLSWSNSETSSAIGQVLLLPLADQQGNCTRAIGCLEYNGRKPKFLNRFYLSGSVVRQVPVQAKRPTYTPNLEPVITPALHLVASNGARRQMDATSEITQAVRPKLRIVK